MNVRMKPPDDSALIAELCAAVRASMGAPSLDDLITDIIIAARELPYVEARAKVAELLRRFQWGNPQ